MGCHSAVIVCTRNRPDDIRRLLETLPGQTVRPSLIVCDSSDDDATRQLVEHFASSGSWPQVQYHHCEPGLTRQRMRSLELLAGDTEIVHFIDDDVVLDPGYFEAIEKTFEEHPDVLGVGGYIVDAGPTPRVSVLARVLGTGSKRYGRITRSGRNVFPFHPSELAEVDWLSGCSMSFRRRVFDSLAFDTRMEGYSLGEDVDFTFRVSRMGRLLLQPDAKMMHLVSDTARMESSRLVEESLVFRHRFVSEMRGHGTSLTAFWWSVFGEMLMTAGKVLVRSDRSRWVGHLRALARGARRILRSGAVRRNPRLGDRA